MTEIKIEISTYDPNLVKPMREEVTVLGFKEVHTPKEAENELGKKGTTFVFINSVCGCAAGKARPGLKLAMEWAERNKMLPDYKLTAFAGMEKAAVAKIRTFFGNKHASSPQFALLKDGELLSLIQRQEIENADAVTVGGKIVRLFQEHCAKN